MEIVTEENCPHCKKGFQSAHELENLEPKINKGKITEVKGDTQSTQQIQQTTEPEVKIVEKVKLPNNKPNYKCKDGRCGNLHPNPDYTQAPSKRCANCGQFGNDEVCEWCKKSEMEDMDPEDLEDFGIEAPKISHEGHEHE